MCFGENPSVLIEPKSISIGLCRLCPAQISSGLATEIYCVTGILLNANDYRMLLTVSYLRFSLHLLLHTVLVSTQHALFDNYTVSSAPVTRSNFSAVSSSDNDTVFHDVCTFEEATLQVLYFAPASDRLNNSATVTTAATTLVSDGFTLFVSNSRRWLFWLTCSKYFSLNLCGV